MKFPDSVPILICCLGLAADGTALLPAQVSSDSRTSPPATVQQPPTGDTPTLPAQTEPTGTTHGHPSETNPGRNAADSGHGAEIAGIAGGVAATIVIIDLIHHHNIVKRLKANGPQLPKAFDMNNLHITGFVQDGWPLAVEYALSGSVNAQCAVTASHKHGVFFLPVTNGARHIVLTRIPAGFSKKPGAADYWLHLDASRIPVNPSGWPGLRVYAVAAGPRAVGSVAIDEVSFAPTDKPVHPAAGEVALFGFHAHSDFDSVTAEFQLVAPYQGRNFVSTEESVPVKPVSEDERVQGLSWQPHKVRSGDHIVRIVAWRGINRGADWVSAFSADMVSIGK